MECAFVQIPVVFLFVPANKWFWWYPFKVSQAERKQRLMTIALRIRRLPKADDWSAPLRSDEQEALSITCFLDPEKHNWFRRQKPAGRLKDAKGRRPGPPSKYTIEFCLKPLALDLKLLIRLHHFFSVGYSVSNKMVWIVLVSLWCCLFRSWLYSRWHWLLDTQVSVLAVLGALVIFDYVENWGKAVLGGLGGGCCSGIALKTGYLSLIFRTNRRMR